MADLTECQIKAIKYCKKKSKVYSKNTINNVKLLFQQNNWDLSYIDKIVDHISKCDVIIHCSLDLIHTFIKNDEKYRNLFEIGRGNSARESWENNLFNNIYENSTATEKVKYGCINLYKERTGCISANSYGDSYLILNKNIKDRCSFVFGDSCRLQPHIATFDHFYQIILYLPKTVIENLMRLIDGKNIKDNNYQYIEVQIHGDVNFRNDVYKIMVNNRHHHNHNILNSISYLNVEFI